ncbi:hypothetical protein B0H17DRAFT_1153438 [Mycena rosella]|uniref:Uncharacterized protein n=1 Tax=Mycena rosella TaxID=1033263 RepID=A0AAD7FAB5_MYCRO|nr:hypothetical protein B0H17DRAFT_1153438 [Mycena rosella]
MGCGRWEADSGKLSKIAGERVARRRRRWDSEALQVISGEGVDEIVNTFTNILCITHDGPVVPRKLGVFVLWVENPARPPNDGVEGNPFPPDLRCLIARSGGTTDGFDGADHGALIITLPLCFSARAVYLQCGGTIWEKWDIWAFGRKANSAKSSDAIGCTVRQDPETASAIGPPNNRGEHNLFFSRFMTARSPQRAAAAALMESGRAWECIDYSTEPAAAAAAALMESVRRPDGAACARDLGGASTVGCCDYTPYYFGDFMVTGRGRRAQRRQGRQG